jgi:hypothetical protein
LHFLLGRSVIKLFEDFLTKLYVGIEIVNYKNLSGPIHQSPPPIGKQWHMYAIILRTWPISHSPCQINHLPAFVKHICHTIYNNGRLHQCQAHQSGGSTHKSELGPNMTQPSIACITDVLKSEWYVVIHEPLPINDRLYRIALTDTDRCHTCGQKDTMAHRTILRLTHVRLAMIFRTRADLISS